MRRSAALASLSALAVLFSTPRANANGRFPSASQLVVDPGEPAHVVVRTTFGLLQSTDEGRTWQWICEKALGYDGVFDPAIAVSGDGSILVGLPTGLSHSRDRACAWTLAAAPISGLYIIDLAVARDDPSRVVAVTSLAEGSPPGAHATLFESIDHGRTFRSGVAVAEDMHPQTLELAPSAPNRVYVSGIAPFARFGMLIRSDDNGATWAETTFDIGAARGAYISGVHPTNADRIYLRIDGDVEDELIFSDNGGQSFTKIFSGAQLLGFALSPDGASVAVGGPEVGIHVSGSDHAFTKVSDVSARCLTWTKKGLWVCGSDPVDPFAVGRATDPSSAFLSLLRLPELQPLACDSATTTGSICPAYWPEISRTINPPKDAGTDATGADSATDAPTAATASGNGCDCGFGHRSGANAIVAAAIALLVLRKRTTARLAVRCSADSGQGMRALRRALGYSGPPRWPSESPSRSSS